MRPALVFVAAVALLGIGVLIGMALRPAVEPSVASSAERSYRERLVREFERARREFEAEMAAKDGARLQGSTSSRRRDPVRAAEPQAPSRGTAAAEPEVAPPIFPASASMLAVIRALGKAGAKQKDTTFVENGDVFRGRFDRRVEGPVVPGEDRDPKAETEDGTTIVLGDGVHDYAAFSDAHRGRFPADLTFRGTGRNRTLLILHEVGATGDVSNLAFEDLTLDTRGHYLADVRGDEPISLRFERARVIGFDPQPEGAVLLAARHGAVLAKDTRFEAGFGGAPGTGSFFHVRGPFLVRFERCTIRGAFRSLYEKSARAAYAWVDCRFEQMDPARRRDLEAEDPNLLFEGCLVDYRLDGAELPGPRSRSELNPLWK